MKNIKSWIGVAVFVVLCVLLAQSYIAKYQNNSNVNPEVFLAMKSIENKASERANKLESGREHELEERDDFVLKNGLARAEYEAYGNHEKYNDSFDYKGYYDRLVNMGYDLPSYYTAGYKPKTPWLFFIK